MDKDVRKALRTEHSKQVGMVRTQYRKAIEEARVKRNTQLQGLTHALDIALAEQLYMVPTYNTVGR